MCVLPFHFPNLWPTSDSYHFKPDRTSESSSTQSSRKTLHVHWCWPKTWSLLSCPGKCKDIKVEEHRQGWQEEAEEVVNMLLQRDAVQEPTRWLSFHIHRAKEHHFSKFKCQYTEISWGSESASDSIGLHWIPWFCISNKLIDVADIAGPRIASWAVIMGIYLQL